MPTAKEQLLSMMSPQAARLLDQQIRSQQVAQRSQGAGMLSGLVQAYTGMSDAFQGITSGMPMGANEAQAIKQQKILDETTKQESLISNAARVAIKSSDVNELQKERDNLLSEGSQAAVSLAQKIQNKIDVLTKQAKLQGIEETKLTTSQSFVNDSDLSDDVKEQINKELTSGLLKPEDVNKRIQDAQKVDLQNKKIENGINAINSLNISQKDKDIYTNALKAGASLTTILQKVVPSEERLTVDRLSQMYRFFTSESVDNFKEEFSKGKRGADLPRLVEQDSERKVNISSVTPSMQQNFISLVDEYIDNEDVRAVFVEKGIFFDSVDKDKVKAFVADVYTYGNRKQLLPSQALIEWARLKNQGVENPNDPKQVSEQKNKPKPSNIPSSPDELDPQLVEKVMDKNPNLTEQQVRELLLEEIRSKVVQKAKQPEQQISVPPRGSSTSVVPTPPQSVSTPQLPTVGGGLFGNTHQRDLQSIQDTQRENARRQEQMLLNRLSGR